MSYSDASKVWFNRGQMIDAIHAEHMHQMDLNSDLEHKRLDLKSQLDQAKLKGDIEAKMEEILSDLEWRVLMSYLDGKSYQEIASDPHVRTLCLILWFALGLSFLFMLMDFGMYSGLKRENLEHRKGSD